LSPNKGLNEKGSEEEWQPAHLVESFYSKESYGEEILQLLAKYSYSEIKTSPLPQIKSLPGVSISFGLGPGQPALLSTMTGQDVLSVLSRSALGTEVVNKLYRAIPLDLLPKIQERAKEWTSKGVYTPEQACVAIYNDQYLDEDSFCARKWFERAMALP
jgi:hypothetical protein